MATRLTERVAVAAGSSLRAAGQTLPGILGPLLVCAGLALAWLPLGIIALGLVLWLFDWARP